MMPAAGARLGGGRLARAAGRLGVHRLDRGANFIKAETEMLTLMPRLPFDVGRDFLRFHQAVERRPRHTWERCQDFLGCNHSPLAHKPSVAQLRSLAVIGTMRLRNNDTVRHGPMTTIPMTVLRDGPLRTLWFDHARRVSRTLPQSAKDAHSHWVLETNRKWWEWPPLLEVIGPEPDYSIPLPHPDAPSGSDLRDWLTFGEWRDQNDIAYTTAEKLRAKRLVPMVRTDTRWLLRRADANALTQQLLNEETIFTTIWPRPPAPPVRPKVPKGTPRSITPRLRFLIFHRDQFTCCYCGRSAPNVVLEVDHIHPWSKGGTNDLSNLTTACYDCNRGKRDRILMEAEQ